MIGILGRKDTIENTDDKLGELTEIMQYLGSIVQLARPVAQKGKLHKSSSS